MTNAVLHNKQLAKIHVLKKQMGLDEETYRALLVEKGGKSSAKDMTTAEKAKVIQWMAGYLYGKQVADEFPDRSSLGIAINELRRQMARHGNYVGAIARRMFGNSDLRKCTVIELGMVLAALREQRQREVAG